MYKARDLDEQGCDQDVSVCVGELQGLASTLSWGRESRAALAAPETQRVRLAPFCHTSNPQLIARMGRWLRDALTLSYLKFFTPEALLAGGGWDKNRLDSYFAERFYIPVTDSLKAQVFPFLAMLRQQVGPRGSPHALVLHATCMNGRTAPLSACNLQVPECWHTLLPAKSTLHTHTCTCIHVHTHTPHTHHTHTPHTHARAHPGLHAGEQHGHRCATLCAGRT